MLESFDGASVGLGFSDEVDAYRRRERPLAPEKKREGRETILAESSNGDSRVTSFGRNGNESVGARSLVSVVWENTWIVLDTCRSAEHWTIDRLDIMSQLYHKGPGVDEAQLNFKRGSVYPTIKFNTMISRCSELEMFALFV